MKTEYPVVPIDRVTHQELLPLFLQRGIFSNYSELRKKEEIIEEEKLRLNKTALTPQEEREVLSREGEYIEEGFVYKDYGTYSIGFSPTFYLGILNDVEDTINTFFNAGSRADQQKVNQALSRIKLYKLAHKIAIIIISEAYSQKKTEDVRIEKSRILELLGYDSSETHIYRDIDDVMFSFQYLSYRIFQYNTNNKLKNTKTHGVFIYEVTEDSKSYTVKINKRFLGCVELLIANKKNKKEDLGRGYDWYPTSLLPLSKNYSTPTYMLSNFLVFEKGNVMIKNKKENEKVVAFTISRFMKEMKITDRNKSKRKNKFIKALGEVEFIKKTEPSIDKLKNIKPRDFEEFTLWIYVDSDIKTLDQMLKPRHLGIK